MILTPGTTAFAARHVGLQHLAHSAPMNTDLVTAARTVADGAIEVAGGRALDIEVREVHARPGRDLIIGFDASVEWGPGDVRAEVVFVAEDQLTGSTTAWRYPSDPVLSGLADAVTSAAVASFLGRPAVELTVVALRPCRRAVIRARSEALDVHIKVVEPAALQAILDRHRFLSAARLPIPELVDVDHRRGWLLWRTVTGRTLDECLDDSNSVLPSADDIISLVESFAAVQTAPPFEAASPVAAALQHAALLTRVVPSVGIRASRIARTCASWPFEAWRGTLHGDLHPGQVMVDDEGRIVGVVDIDGAGVGEVGDDVARMLAHVMVATELGQAEVDRRREFAVQFCRVATQRMSTDELRHRVAASLIGLATGPWRAQEPSWPDQVERLVDLADAVLDTGVEGAIRSRRSP